MKKQQVFPPSQAPSQWSRWVTHLYGTSTAPHTCAAHTRTHTHTHAVHKQGGCVYHTHTKMACCVQDIYIYICRTGPGPRGALVEITFIERARRCHGTSTNCARHLHVCTPSNIHTQTSKGIACVHLAIVKAHS